MGCLAAAKALASSSGETDHGQSTLRADCHREPTGGAEEGCELLLVPDGWASSAGPVLADGRQCRFLDKGRFPAYPIVLPAQRGSSETELINDSRSRVAEIAKPYTAELPALHENPPSHELPRPEALTHHRRRDRSLGSDRAKEWGEREVAPNSCDRQ
jgi:hypothetical protein